jgi:hypothetical protein
MDMDSSEERAGRQWKMVRGNLGSEVRIQRDEDEDAIKEYRAEIDERLKAFEASGGGGSKSKKKRNRSRKRGNAR